MIFGGPTSHSTYSHARDVVQIAYRWQPDHAAQSAQDTVPPSCLRARLCTAAVTTPAAEGAPDGDLALCLDVGAGEGGAVTFTECTGDVNQRFGSLLGDTIDKAEPNAFAITGRRGTDFEGLCLTAQDDGSLSMMECPEVIPESSTGDVEVNLGALWLFPALILPLDPASA